MKGDQDLNLPTPMSDQDRISPYNIIATSSRQVMRIKKNIARGLLFDPRPNSKLTARKLYGRHYGELRLRSGSLRVKLNGLGPVKTKSIQLTSFVIFSATFATLPLWVLFL